MNAPRLCSPTARCPSHAATRRRRHASGVCQSETRFDRRAAPSAAQQNHLAGHVRVSSPVTFLFTANTESPSMKKITRYIDQITNRIIPNDSAQTRTRHRDDNQVSLPYSSAPVPSSSLPTRPRSSTPTGSRSKGLFISCGRRRIGKKSTSESRCTSIALLLPGNNC